jgi:hypothetical protein
MQSRHLWIIIVIVAILAVGIFKAGSQQLASEGSHLPWRPPGPPPAAMCTDGQNLFVQHGPFIYQFSTTDLILKKKYELPRPEPHHGQEQQQEHK